MGANLAVNLRYMVIEAEGTPGTMETPLTADHVIRIRDINLSPDISFDNENSKYAQGNHAEDEAIAGMQAAEITCSVKVAYSGTVTTEPNWWKLCKMCGLGAIGWNSDTEVAVGSAVEGISLVNRAAYDDVSYTCWVFDTEVGSSPATKIYKLKGCMGNVVFTAENVGAPVMANFTIRGALSDIVDGDAIAMSAPQTQLPQAWLNSATTIFGTWTAGVITDGTTVCASSFSLDLGNDIQPLICQSEATGIKQFVRTATRPRLSINPLAVKQATTDDLAQILAQTTGGINIALGTNMRIKALDAQKMNPGLASREGLVNWEHTFRCLQNGVPGTLADTALDLEDTIEIAQGLRT